VAEHARRRRERGVNAPFDLSVYREALLFLVTAGVIAPIFSRLRISPVLGYILAGAVLGPFGLGELAGRVPFIDLFALTSVETIDRLAAFGVVTLMFMIGLELSFERLKTLRRLVFGLGLGQVVISTALMAAAAMYFGQTPPAAIIFGAALSLSSTAIVAPVLAEHKLQTSPLGRYSFAILLFQDLAVAPLLFMAAMLARGNEGNFALSFALALAPAAVAVAVVIGIGRWLLRPMFHSVALTKNTESFMAACLLVVLGSALIAAASGLSMALGAFLAGVLLAETEFRREIEVTIEPFKGLLLGLYFVSVGAELDLSLAASRPLPVVAVLAAFVALKALAILPLARVFGANWATARDVAVLLGPGGEFAFVLIGGAIASDLIDPESGRIALVAAALSMVTIPFLGRGLAALAARRRARDLPPEALAAPPEDEEPRVIIVGFGRVGTLIADMLDVHKIPYIAVDNDPRVVASARTDGRPAYFGDASRPDFLRRCGIEDARALVVTMDVPLANIEVVEATRRLRPDITLVARARDAEHAMTLYELGVTDAVPETIEASLQLSEAVLVDLGIPMGFVIASIHEKRDEYRKRLIASGATVRVRSAKRKPAVEAP
jgi:CPA2 family monovalent cation:H+ antiporter-2